MIAAVNELSMPGVRLLRPRDPTSASGTFGAALARSAAAVDERAKASAPRDRTAPSLAAHASRPPEAAEPAAPEPIASASPAARRDAASSVGAPPRPADAVPSATAAPLSPTEPEALAGAPPAELAPAGSVKSAARKAAPSCAAQHPQACDDAVDIAASGTTAQAVALQQPLLPPLASPPARGDVDADARGARDAAAPLALVPTGAPAPPGTEQAAGDSVPPPAGDFRALLPNIATPFAPPPPPPRGKPGAAAPVDSAPAPVARADALGLQIVRHIAAGKDMLSVALSPESLGRVEVQMRFDDTGTLRALVSASTPEALALLHRDSAALDQAMTSAGVRTDAQSFQFDSRASQHGDRSPHPFTHAERVRSDFPDVPDPAEAAMIQPLRSSGTLDLLA